MKILITGCSGYIGSEIVFNLRNENFLIGIDKNKTEKDFLGPILEF